MNEKAFINQRNLSPTEEHGDSHKTINHAAERWSDKISVDLLHLCKLLLLPNFNFTLKLPPLSLRSKM